MEIEPNNDFVLLAMEEPKLASGIVMPGPNNASLPQQYARFKILKIGPGRMTANGTMIPIMFKVGDYVLVPPPIQVSASTPPRMPCEFTRIGEPEAEGRVLFLIHAADILCRVEGTYPTSPIIERASAEAVRAMKPKKELIVN